MAKLTLYELLDELHELLASGGFDFALIGGLALGPRGFPRATADIDFLIRGDMVERLRALMHQREAEVVTENSEFSSYVIGGIRADFQHARRPISLGMLERADPVEVEGKLMPVIQVEDLMGLKIQAFHNNPRRLQDLVDIQRLMTNNWDTLDFDKVRHLGCSSVSGISMDSDVWLIRIAEEAFRNRKGSPRNPPIPLPPPESPASGAAEQRECILLAEAMRWPEASREPIEYHDIRM